MEFNCNDYVKVRLTDEGRRIHRANYEALVSSMPPLARENVPYIEPKEDADGWSQWQLWELMSQFGPWMRMAYNNPFDMNIRIGD
jgi:hypothetical protein